MKSVLLIITILFCLSCKEKPKPFTYDYVEIAYEISLGNNCEFTVYNIKIDSDSFYYSHFTSRITGTVLRTSDSVEIKINNFASRLFFDSIKDINVNYDSTSETPPFFVFIVKKDGVKKVYKEYPCTGNRDSCGNRETIRIKKDIINIETHKKFITKHYILKTEAIETVLSGWF